MVTTRTAGPASLEVPKKAAARKANGMARRIRVRPRIIGDIGARRKLVIPKAPEGLDQLSNIQVSDGSQP